MIRRSEKDECVREVIMRKEENELRKCIIVDISEIQETISE
jgi:hypothetical protein